MTPVGGLLKPISANIFKSEKQQHPWWPHKVQIFDKPLFRLWDHNSGSQPGEDGCMRSRAKREQPYAFESRKESLTVHIDHIVWNQTPYISCTTSPSKVEDLAKLRGQMHRGPHTLIVVDPNNRIRNGLPVLPLSDEMKCYDVLDPYNKTREYYEDHHICLWEVTRKEVLGCWQRTVVAEDVYHRKHGKKTPRTVGVTAFLVSQLRYFS
ncbi:uncharacterized protein A1O9_08796 [Exophiala aquamarina CBS 119918]|uniref:DUF7587 domain-containing protein n=1 Tax=Exophiala aquamarina CBS 119918 TaxID=1182545 RepID=A0A072P790_9EURO|nr:uncharacterized protein A1O9_08796 [Exophiala aquamarina CBS 119918]KEF55143.1 hypothetical protein A1O9_08796 [Exophiala aquamarina CBS 119918]